MMRFVVAAWSAAVLAVSVLPLTAGYRDAAALLVLLACVLAPFGVVALGRLLRVRSTWVGVAGGVLALAAALLVLDGAAADDRLVLPGWRSSPAFELLGPLIDSVPRLLTAPRPAPGDAALLVPTALFVWLVALGVALAVVGRARAGAAPLVGAATLHLAGALLTAGRGDRYGLAALTTAVVLLLGWVLLPSSARTARTQAGEGTHATPVLIGTTTRARRGVVLPLLVAVVAASFALTAGAVATSRAFEPRTLVPPPELPVEASNPVPALALWNGRPDHVLFTVQADGAPLPARLTLAALPDFDGAAWTVDASLRAVGVVAEPDLPPGDRQTTVSYLLQPDGLTGVWLPSAGRATAVTGADALMDVDTGVLVAPAGLDGSVVAVEGLVDAPTDAAVARAGTPAETLTERYLALPRVPTQLLDEAREATDGAHSRWEQASRLADAVRGDRTLDPGAPSGSSYGRIQEFLYLPAEEGGQVGTSEQFAASFAVLARAVGLPTRLVVGFDLPDDAATSGAPVEVTGEHARAWAEVYFSRVGWVAFDPSPATSSSTDIPPPPDLGSGGGEDPIEQDDVPDAAPEDTAAGEDQPVPDVPARGAAATIVAGLALVGSAVPAVLALARARRRRGWRTAGAPGAWAHVLDAAVLAGRAVPASATAPDLARTLGEEASTAVVLAERAERQAFAPAAGGAPGADGVPVDAGTSWQLGREVETALRRAAPWWRRVVWSLSPAVFRRGPRRQPRQRVADEPASREPSTTA